MRGGNILQISLPQVIPSSMCFPGWTAPSSPRGRVWAPVRQSAYAGTSPKKRFERAELGSLSSLGCRNLHGIRVAKLPIQAHLERIHDLADPIEVKRPDARRGEIHSAPPANADAAAYSFVCHTADAAGFGQPVSENAEIYVHGDDLRGACLWYKWWRR